MAAVTSREVARHSARLDGVRRKVHRTRSDLRGLAPEARESLRLAEIQLRFAIEELDRLAGERARSELKG